MVTVGVPEDSSFGKYYEHGVHRDMVVASIFAGIEVNVGVQIVDEWRQFYSRERSARDLFLPSLIT